MLEKSQRCCRAVGFALLKIPVNLAGDNQVLDLLPVTLRPLFRVFTVRDLSVYFDVLHYL